MTYREWTETSETYQAYQAASTACETQILPLRLAYKIREARFREDSLLKPWISRKHTLARWEREVLEELFQEAEAAAERAAQEARQARG